MNKSLIIRADKEYQKQIRRTRYGMFNREPFNIAPSKLDKLPLGTIESHELLLNQPKILIYKFIKFDYLIRSINDHYLHFNRVDSYKDFEGADINDGDQTSKDRAIHQNMNFIKGGSLEAYYDKARSRSYACCFTRKKTPHMQNNYGEICIVFEFNKLRKALNEILDFSYLVQNNNMYLPIFNINYGYVQYCNWDEHSTGGGVNPINYLYLKDAKYKNEQELRISLSAIGCGKFVSNDRSNIDFSPSLQLEFNWQEAIDHQIIQKIICGKDVASKLPEFINLKPTLLPSHSQKSSKSIS